MFPSSCTHFAIMLSFSSKKSYNTKKKLRVQTVCLMMNPRGSIHVEYINIRIKALILKVWVSLIYVA
jgi:hypothetical protein